MRLRVQQLNVGRSHVAHSDLGQLINSHQADVVLVQEPFLRPGGHPLQYNGLTGGSRPRAVMYVRDSLAVLLYVI